MTGETAVALVCSFAAGVLVALNTEDWRKEKEQEPPTRSTYHYTPRPRCPGEWIITQADNQRPVGACLKARVRVPTRG